MLKTSTEIICVYAFGKKTGIGIINSRVEKFHVIDIDKIYLLKIPHSVIMQINKSF